MQDLFLLALVLLVFTFFALFFSGFVGPRWWRSRIREFNRWYYKDSSLFFPFDPDKPLLTSIKEGLRTFWPTEERWRSLNKPLPLSWVLIISLSMVGPVLLILLLLSFLH
jgi:hypothetical protein